MSILVTYVSRVVGFRILWVLLSFVGLFVLVDMIDNVEDILARDGNLADVAIFAGYRLPTIIDRLLPICVLIGSTLGVLSLATHSELIVLRSAGLSQIRMAALGLPVCMMIVLGHYVVGNHITPSSERAFIAWWDSRSGTDDELWLRGDATVLRLGRVSQDATRLEAIDIFRRDEIGQLVARVQAGSATFENAGWMLKDISTIDIERGAVSIVKNTHEPWPDGPAPEVILDLVAVPDQLSRGALETVLQVEWRSTAEPAAYGTELARRSAGPLASLIMMLIAASSIRGSARLGRLHVGALNALGLGLTFLVVEGIAASAGKAGILAPAVAAWAPLGIFAGIAGFLFMRFER